MVPGVVYGAGGDNVAFKVPGRELRLALAESSAVVDLKIGRKRALPVIVKQEQRHPVRDELLHVDMLQVRLDETIQSAIMVELVGGDDAPGIKAGGVFGYQIRELNVEALPSDLPEYIEIDVSGMEAAETMHLSDVGLVEDVEFIDPPDTIIATITLPTQMEEPEEEVEEETELVGEAEEESEPEDSDSSES
jgi:large subunit ribosomal protein L25